MKTIGDIRRANLEILIAEAGTLAAVADKADLHPVYLNQVRNQAADTKTGRPRELGTRGARQLETAFNKDRGWMDEAHYGAPPPTPPLDCREPATTDDSTYHRSLDVRDILRYAGADERKQFLDRLRVQLVRARSHYSDAEFKQYLDTLDDIEHSDNMKRRER